MTKSSSQQRQKLHTELLEKALMIDSAVSLAVRAR